MLTDIQVEDLFYNVPTRRRAFRSASEEYAKILDVVGRYAVHCSGVAFSCRKHGDSGMSISTPSSASTIDRIRQIHGSAVANELVEFNVQDSKLGFRSSGLATNANYHVKKTGLLLFINHRAVESTAIKRAVEQTYSPFLPKGGHPFAYLDIEIEPNRVDVNVHPTKREVNFLNEDEIIEAICGEIRSKLAQVDSSRTFLTQSLLPGMHTIETVQAGQGSSSGVSTASAKIASTPKTPATSKRPQENSLVRTDSKVRKITSMLAPNLVSSPSHPDTPSELGNALHPIIDEGLQYENTDRQPLRIALTSVKNLRSAVRSTMHSMLTEMFASHTYVGLVDERRRLVAIQSGVKLYLVDYGLACNEFFYQVGLTDFGNFGVIQLEPPPKLVDLLGIAADSERQEHSNMDDDIAEGVFASAAELVSQTLVDRREMLYEYFSLKITEDGYLLTIPLLLKGYVPSLAKLPRFLLRLGPYVNWTDEEECFRTFLRELAAFYTPEQLPVSSRSAKEATPLQGSGEESYAGAPDVEEDQFIVNRRVQLGRMLEHTIFPAFRARLVATSRMLRGVIEVADLKGLYRVFERC